MGNSCSPGFAGGVFDGVFLCYPFYPLDVLDEIWDLIESVSEGCLAYSPKQRFFEISIKLANGYWRRWPLKIFHF